MSDAPNLFDRGVAAYEAGDFAAAQTHWEQAAAAGDLQARDHLMLLNTGATRRRVLLERMAERANANAIWSLGVAAVEQADLPGVREHWAQAADLDPALADEVAGLLECDPAVAAEQLRTLEAGPLAFRLGELCLSTGLNETALVWWNLAVIAGSAEAEALLKRLTSD
jgi:tetratricopeptide (TPR) repeat protein